MRAPAASRTATALKAAPIRKKQWLNLLNRLSFLTSVIGLGWYGVLLSKGDYERWAMPILIASFICKLLSTSPQYEFSTLGDSQSNPLRLTLYARLKESICIASVRRKISSIYIFIVRKLSNDNHSNLIFLSLLCIVAPCAIFFVARIHHHLLPFMENREDIDHEELANDFGKLGSAAFGFLLLPVSKHSSLFHALKLSEVHVIRLHICAGCIALFGGICHGLYYTYIWVLKKGYTYQDVFPTEKECWHGVFFHEEYDKKCHSKFVNVLGITCAISLLFLGASSLFRVRRQFYKFFYTVHIIVSIIVLFGLVMHYNKMIFYVAPSFLCYIGSNLPICIESFYKWQMLEGVKVTKVVCIPDSGGCVEMSLSINNGDTLMSLGDDFRSFHDTIGKFVKLQIPELSRHSHPFTIFSNPHHPGRIIHLLFRPCGSFTQALSNRLHTSTKIDQPKSKELQDYSRNSACLAESINNNESLPTVLVNGIRSGTVDMFESIISDQGKVVIIAGGVGIASYLSLIHAYRQHCLMAIRKSTRDEELDCLRDCLGDNDGPEQAFESNNPDNLSASQSGRSDHQNVKSIDVHWLSRDEGLIKHVLKNYIEPFRHVKDDTLGPSGALCSTAVNFAVHHTSPNFTSVAKREFGNERDMELESNAWVPSKSQNHSSASAAAGDSAGSIFTNDRSHASPTSIFHGNKLSSSSNSFDSFSFAFIVFGGMTIVKYCYYNLQDKYIVETRPIAVVIIVAFSFAIAVASNAVAFCAKSLHPKLFSYTKLDGSAVVESATNVGNGENGCSEIECIHIPNDKNQLVDTDIRFRGDEEQSVADQNIMVGKSSDPRSTRREVLRISHRQGRPDLAAIVQHCATVDGHDNQIMFDCDSDSGKYSKIFVCGPKEMTRSILEAVNKRVERRNPCNQRTQRVVVYQEIFEL